MRYDVAEQLKEGTLSLRKYEVNDSFSEGEDGLGHFQITGNLSLLGSNRGILALGQLHTDIRMECARCLEPFWQSLDLSIEQEYTPRRDIKTGAPLKSTSEEESFFIDENFILDLREEVRQQIILALPMKPVCRVDCLGLCPNCGANLNFGPCPCVNRVDERLAPLQGLLGRLRR